MINTGSSTSTGGEHKKFIIKRIGELEVNVIAVNNEMNLRSRCITHWILSDLTDHDKTIRAIEHFMSANPEVTVDGVITFYEDAVLLTSKISDHFGFVGIPFEVADVTRNKYKFRDFCAQNGLPTPKYQLINNRSDLKLVQEHLRFPIVLKPIYGASSAFVIKVEDAAALMQTYEYIQKNISKKLESALDSISVLMAEEYIDGDEVDINILIQNGRIKFFNITDNHQTNEPFFIETGMTEPSALPELDKKKLIDMADAMLEILGIQNGCMQFEAKSTYAGPMPLEINLRMGGDEAWSFAKHAWGVDMIELALKIAVNQYFDKVNKPISPRKYLAGETLHATDSGVIAQIDVDDIVKNNKYVEDIYLFKQPGDTIMVPPFGYEYMGWVSVSGDNQVDATDKLKYILKHINYSIVKFDEFSSIGKTKLKGKGKYAVFAPAQNKLILGKEKIEKIRFIPLVQQRKLHIGIAGNDYGTDAQNDYMSTLLTSASKQVEATLIDLGYKVSFFNFNNPLKAIDAMNKSQIDLVFNTCKRINDTSILEPNAAGIFDIMQIPYIGSNALTLALSKDKIKVKKLLNSFNIPTPNWDYVYTVSDEVDQHLEYPLIVKPVNTDNLHGIHNDSVVYHEKELSNKVRHIIQELGSPVLIEEYIDGDEYDIFILGNDIYDFKIFPLCRTVFTGLPTNYSHIKTLDRVYGNDKEYEKHIITQIPPRKVNDKLISLITEIAVDTYNILDCHDYGHIVVRVDKNNNPYVLGFNPNPLLGYKDFPAKSARVIGLSHSKFLEDIVKAAIQRYKKASPHPLNGNSFLF